jgi:hypothetical protein
MSVFGSHELFAPRVWHCYCRSVSLVDTAAATLICMIGDAKPIANFYTDLCSDYIVLGGRAIPCVSLFMFAKVIVLRGPNDCLWDVRARCPLIRRLL